MKEFAYLRNSRYFAQLAEGLEEAGAGELADLGAQEIKPVYRGLHFEADRPALYRIVYTTRLCSRILAPLLRFSCHSSKYLYRTARQIEWHNLFGPEHTFAVAATVAHSHIRHSQYAGLCLKDAVVDHFRELTGRRPSVDRHDPDLRLNLHIEGNMATISLDLSGGSLHRRGYRRESVAAPMQETLAAAIIRLTGWQGERPLVDPMCGSGTLLCEALMHCCHLPAGLFRSRFGFELLPDFEAPVWQAVRQAADAAIRPLPPGLIGGSDCASEAIRAARANCRELPGGDLIRLEQRSFQEQEAIQDAVIVTNPPYGVRLGKKEESGQLLKSFGDFLKRRCTGCSAFLYLGDRELVKRVGLHPAWKKPLRNGGLDGLLVKYELY